MPHTIGQCDCISSCCTIGCYPSMTFVHAVVRLLCVEALNFP